jgi:hypothetical protein
MEGKLKADKKARSQELNEFLDLQKLTKLKADSAEKAALLEEFKKTLDNEHWKKKHESALSKEKNNEHARMFEQLLLDKAFKMQQINMERKMEVWIMRLIGVVERGE